MFRKMIAAGLVLMVLALVVAGSVFAQGPSARPTTPGTGFVDENADGICDLYGSGTPQGARMGGLGMMGARWSDATLLSVVAQELDLSTTDLVAELQGQTLREVIVAHNGDADAIVAKFVEARSAALQELVTAGRLTQAQADQMIANMQTQVAAQLDATQNWATGPALGGQGRGCGMGRSGATQGVGMRLGGIRGA